MRFLTVDPMMKIILCLIGFTGAFIYLNATSLPSLSATVVLILACTIGGVAYELRAARRHHPLVTFAAVMAVVSIFLWAAAAWQGTRISAAELGGMALIVAGMAAISR